MAVETVPIVEQDTNRAQLRPTLRLAVAMRGGVSLAVWTGGALAELDVMRRAMAMPDDPVPPPIELGPESSRRRSARRRQRSRREHKAKQRRANLREERRRIYRDLLDLADLDHVEIDVLAGASAGGLNAVLYGTALANGQRIDDMREVWADLAEIQPLLRQTAKRPGRFIPSPLSGDEYFYEVLRKQLDRLAELDPELVGSSFDEPDEPKPAAAYLTIALSATMLPTTNSHGIRERRERGADSGRASFSFSLRPTTADRSILSDLPVGRRGDATWRNFLIDRLALAGRSTSSFPGAFEPARVCADPRNWAKPAYHPSGAEPRGEASRDPTSYSPGPLVAMPDMMDVFSAVRLDDPDDPDSARRPFTVVDGGVFDNIAISRALTAIAHAPAQVHTRRWLIYLDPDPAKPPVPRSGLLRPAAFTVPRLIASVVRMRAASSTVNDDLEALQQHNERVQARRTTIDAYSHQLINELETIARSAGDNRARKLREFGRRLARPSGDTMREYGRYRAATDLPRLTRLLVRPQQTISGQVIRKKTFEAWAEGSVGELQVRLRRPLYEWYSDNGARLHTDLTAIMHTAEFLITWCRALEAWHHRATIRSPDTPPLDRVGERKRLKRVLYRVLFIATALRDLADQAMLAPFAGEGLDKRVKATLPRVHDTQSTYRLSSLLDVYFNPGLDPEENVLTPPQSDAMFYDEAATYLRGLTEPNRGRPEGDPVPDVQRPAIDCLWARLTEMFHLVRELSTTTEERLGDGPDGSDRPWRDSPYRVLTLYPELVQPLGTDDGSAPALADLGPIFAGAGGLPDNEQMVDFYTSTADEFSPLYRNLERLGAAVAVDWAREMLRGRIPDMGRPWLDSRSKLAGNQLANFAGFLDRRWRSNDWMWGRADSAANTVSLLIRQVDQQLLDSGRASVIEAANRLAATVGVPGRSTWNRDDIKRLGNMVTERLQRSIVEELVHTAFGDDERQPWFRRIFRRRPPDRTFAHVAQLTTGQETPAVLAPSRRSGLIFHAGLLLFRAMHPSTKGRPLTFLMRGAALLARPFVVLALLTAMPARAALLLGLVLAGTAASSSGPDGTSSVRAGVLGGIAAVGVLVFGIRANVTRRRRDNARGAIRTLKEQAAAPPVDAEGPAVPGTRQDAVDHANTLARFALSTVERIYRRRRAAAIVLAALSVMAAGLAALYWNRVGPWLAEGNAASAGGLAAAELLAMVMLWRVSDRPLRPRTGTRRPRHPWFIWSLALVAVAGAVAAGHIDRLVTLFKKEIEPTGITDPGVAWLAIAAGAALLCAMVFVSTFDWMRMSWLPTAWLMALVPYAVLIFLSDQIGLPIMLIGNVAFASIAYGFSFSYLITVFCESRYPKDGDGRLGPRHGRPERAP